MGYWKVSVILENGKALLKSGTYVSTQPMLMEQRTYSPNQREQHVANTEDVCFEKPTKHCIVEPHEWKESLNP